MMRPSNPAPHKRDPRDRRVFHLSNFPDFCPNLILGAEQGECVNVVNITKEGSGLLTYLEYSFRRPNTNHRTLTTNGGKNELSGYIVCNSSEPPRNNLPTTACLLSKRRCGRGRELLRSHTENAHSSADTIDE